jgi:hypothetical protein
MPLLDNSRRLSTHQRHHSHQTSHRTLTRTPARASCNTPSVTARLNASHSSQPHGILNLQHILPVCAHSLKRTQTRYPLASEANHTHQPSCKSCLHWKARSYVRADMLPQSLGKDPERKLPDKKSVLHPQHQHAKAHIFSPALMSHEVSAVSRDSWKTRLSTRVFKSSAGTMLTYVMFTPPGPQKTPYQREFVGVHGSTEALA